MQRSGLRSLKSLNGVRSSVRYNSSEPGKSPFLSDILARIEKINLTKNTNKAPETVKAKGAKKTSKQKNTTPQKKTQPIKNTQDGSKPRTPKIFVQNHPMASGRLDRGRIENGVAKTGGFLDARGPRRVHASGERTGETGERSGDRRPARSGNSRPRRAGGPQTRGPIKAAKFDDAATLNTRAATVEQYRPSLSNRFLYGKSTNFQTSLTSRITSVIKSQLLDSKYPFNLPKNVIDNAPETTNSSFLLSKSSFSLDVDADKIKSDINNVVKGEGKYIEVTTKADQCLNKNPTMTLDQKFFVSSLAKGNGIKEVLNNAHWK